MDASCVANGSRSPLESTAESTRRSAPVCPRTVATSALTSPYWSDTNSTPGLCPHEHAFARERPSIPWLAGGEIDRVRLGANARAVVGPSLAEAAERE